MFLLKAAAAVLRTKWYPNAAEWARYNRILPNDSAEPGPFNPSRTPYMLPIYDTVADIHVHSVTAVMGTQMSKTEFCLNVVGESLDTKAQPILIVMPTQKMAEDMSKDRFHKMVKLCPSLFEKLAKGRMNQVYVKWVGGNRIGFAWASSASQLCSNPAGLVILDERDHMPDDVDREGDPVKLAEARTATYPNAKIIITSTPTIDGASAIWKLFMQGTRAKWHLPCLQCGALILPCLEIFGYDEKTLQGYLLCPKCKAKLYEKERQLMLPRGQYVIECPEAKAASFWVSGLCSPWRTLDKIAKSLSDARQSNDPRQLQTCVNTVFGECFAIKGESITIDLFENLKQLYQRGTIPDGVLVITCGCDVHKDNIHYVIRGWGKDNRSWLLDYGIIYGETDGEEIWQKLDRIIKTPLGDDKKKMKISLVCIDCGYRTPFVYAYCRTMSICKPCKGYEHQSSPIRLSATEVTVTGQRFKAGGKRYDIDDGYFKILLFSRILNGQWYLPTKIDDEFLRQIASEEQIINEKGQMIWKEKYKNHYLDCEKLNIVAADIIRVDLLDSPKEFQRVRSEGIDIWQ